MDITKVAKFLGKKGGDKTLAKHGKEHFSIAGKKGAMARWGSRSKTK